MFLGMLYGRDVNKDVMGKKYEFREYDALMKF